MKTNPLTAQIVIICGLFLLNDTVTAQQDPLGDISHLSEKEKKEVRSYFLYGRKAWESEDFKTAAVHFKKVHAISDISVFLYHTARCYEELQEYATAIRYFKRYMKDAPETATQSDTPWRVERLEGILADRDKKTNFVASTDAHSDEPGAIKGVSVGLLTGLLGVPTTPNNASKIIIPFDLTAQLNFSRWFMLTGGVSMGKFIKDSSIDWSTSNNAVESQTGLHLGFAFAAPLADIFSMYIKLQFAPAWLHRYGDGDAISFMGFQAMVGGFVHLTRNWTLIIEGGSNIGRIRIPNPSPGSPWENDADDWADLGCKIGLSYTFKFVD